MTPLTYRQHIFLRLAVVPLAALVASHVVFSHVFPGQPGYAFPWAYFLTVATVMLSCWEVNLFVFRWLDNRLPFRENPVRRFVLVMGPPLLLLIGLLITNRGRSWIGQLPLSWLTLLHTVRVPVELTLYGLYLHQQIPQLMTFEGCNYDILAGLTAPVLAYFVFRKSQLSTRWLLAWHALALGLVLNIVIYAVLSLPGSLQQLAFEQPNVAVLKGSYVWLPGFIVPAVLFSHAVAIQRLVTTSVYVA